MGTVNNNIPKPIGIKDVARHAGVSISTVSNVLNGKKAVSPALKIRVMESVDALGYQANPIGRQLKTGRSMQIAFLVPSITSVFFPDVLKSMQSAADAAGYTVSVFGTKGLLSQERRIVNMLWGQGYDGILLDSCADIDLPETSEYLDFLDKLNSGPNPIHIICVETAISSKLDAVVINDADGIFKATEYLIKKGRSHFVYIAAPNQYIHAKNRKRGFITALAMHGIPLESAMIEEGNFSCISGYEAMERVFEQNKPFDAVVCGNDQMAIGAIRCLIDHNRHIPDDVAVIGFNGNAPASLITPSLSTVSVPKAEMGSLAFELFQRRASGDNSPHMQIQLEGNLLLRQSTDSNIIDSWDMNW